jgi:acetyltransferase-like isoleucine patch superfamily enzyme
MNSISRLVFILLKWLAFSSRIFGSRDLYMFFTTKAYRRIGVQFRGKPRYIDPKVFLDASGGLILGSNIVLSRDVLILTHDYSYTAGLISLNKRPKTDIAILAKVEVGDNCFIGARVTILPGTKIGKNVVISGGSVVKGLIKDNSIVAGNPAEKIMNTDNWAEFMEKNIGSKRVHIDKK